MKPELIPARYELTMTETTLALKNLKNFHRIMLTLSLCGLSCREMDTLNSRQVHRFTSRRAEKAGPPFENRRWSPCEGPSIFHASSLIPTDERPGRRASD